MSDAPERIFLPPSDAKTYSDNILITGQNVEYALVVDTAPLNVYERNRELLVEVAEKDDRIEALERERDEAREYAESYFPWRVEHLPWHQRAATEETDKQL